MIGCGYCYAVMDTTEAPAHHAAKHTFMPPSWCDAETAYDITATRMRRRVGARVVGSGASTR